MDNRYDDLIDNENFYKIMNPYIESGILTEIYSSKYISVFNLANKTYVTCLHMIVDDSVVGHEATKPIINHEIKDNLFAFKMQKDSARILPASCGLFNKEKFSYWQKYSTNSKIKSETDPKFDEKIMKKYPKESGLVSGAKPTNSAVRRMIKNWYANLVHGDMLSVLYLIAGALAVLQVIMLFMPHLIGGGNVFLPVEIFGGGGTSGKFGIHDRQHEIGFAYIDLFFILVVFDVFWAVLSFMQKKLASIFGVVVCAISFIINIFWVETLSFFEIDSYARITPFPIFMVMISFAGIIVSIAQIVRIVKKEYPKESALVSGAKPTLLYIIAGVMAALQVLMFFLPHLSDGDNVLRPVEMFGGVGVLDKFGVYDNPYEIGVAFIFLVIVVALEVVWAVLSFMKKKPAGIFGVVACALGVIIHLVWFVVICHTEGGSYFRVSQLPFFMLLLSYAGIPVSIVQIVKKKYLS